MSELACLREVLRAISCEDWARFVFNAMHCRSACLGEGGCCVMQVDTDAISIPSDSEEEFEMETGCCDIRARH